MSAEELYRSFDRRSREVEVKRGGRAAQQQAGAEEVQPKVVNEDGETPLGGLAFRTNAGRFTRRSAPLNRVLGSFAEMTTLRNRSSRASKSGRLSFS